MEISTQNRRAHLSQITPLHNNRMNYGLIHLKDKAIHAIGDLMEKKTASDL